MKYYLVVFTLFYFCSSNLIIAQPKSRNIFFNSTTDIVRLHFTGQTPAVNYTGLNSGSSFVAEGLAHAERNDTILLFVNANGVYDRDLVKMPGSNGILANPSSTEINICPFPGDKNKYYIFYNGETCTELYYSVVDMTLRGGLGDVTALNVVLDNSDHAEGMEVVREPCSENFWLITYKCRTGFDIYHITNSGISTGTIYPYVPTGNPFTYSGRGQVEYHQGKLAMGIGFFELIYTGDFDPQTGVVSNGAEVNFPVGLGGTYGVQFSPDGSKLFVTPWYVVNSDNLFQVNVSDLQVINSWTIPIQCSGPAPGIGAIVLGPNGKLYIPETDGCSIVEIADPDSDAPQYTLIPLNNNLSLGGSDLLQSDYFKIRQQEFAYAGCNIDSVKLVLPVNLTQVSWQTDADMYTTIGTSNSILVPSDTTITYFASGLDAQNCEQAYAYTIKPASPSPIDLGPDLAKEVCTDDDFITLSVDPSLNTSFKWSTGSTLSSEQIREPGVYKVTVTNSYNCSYTDSVKIDYTYRSGVQIPNLFTPNGDQKNDHFALPGSECAKDFYLEIYNRWGDKVFESTSPFFVWSGHNVSDGLYYYSVSITWRTNESIFKKGWVQVIR